MDDLVGLDDHLLLAGGVDDAIAENRASARRWARLVEFFRRREAEWSRGRSDSPALRLTPRQETVVEVCELWGLAESWARSQVNVALFLSTYCAQVWGLCQSGQLDGFRARMIADAARHGLDHPEEFFRLAERLEPFLDRHLTGVDGLDQPAMVRCTPKQLRNKLAYEINLLRSADAEARHRRAYADRSVRATEVEDGMAFLGIGNTVDRVRLAENRLTLAAKELRANGDERTLDQLRADLALDLLTGREADMPLPTYARPIINVTVPIQTLLGISDHPGVLSGGTVLPAALTRRIAAEPEATWHRMLTDPAGEMVELSTKSYQPTAPIWRRVVADHDTCFRPTCDRPATTAELDHRVAWPQGRTSTANLWPACKGDHTAKHAPGFRVHQAADGSLALRTRAGFGHRIVRSTHPSSAEWRDPGPEIQLSATELLEALEHVRSVADSQRAERAELAWEHDAGPVLERMLRERMVA